MIQEGCKAAVSFCSSTLAQIPSEISLNFSTIFFSPHKLAPDDKSNRSDIGLKPLILNLAYFRFRQTDTEK